MRKKKIVKEIVKERLRAIKKECRRHLKEIDLTYNNYIREIKENPLIRQKKTIPERLIEILSGRECFSQAETMIRQVEKQRRQVKKIVIEQARILTNLIKKWERRKNEPKED